MVHRCFVLLVVAGFSLTWVQAGLAQIYPPRPGVPLPSGYREQVERDPKAFQFKRAWMAETQRLREGRRDTGDLAVRGRAPAVSGTKRVPVLAGRFSNSSLSFSVADLAQRLFEGPNPTGTITDYYHEVSYGRITLTGDVVGSGSALFRLPRTDAYYEGGEGCNGLCGQAKTGEFLKALLDGTDPQLDFSLYDNDGPDGLPNSGDDDGYVDFVAFVHPEYGGECGGSNLWSHRWVYEGWWGDAYETNDVSALGGNIKVSDYTIQPLLSCDRSSLIEIGVYTHEFGHAFGLPDLYDTNPDDGESEGIGNWGLMASGSWGGDGSHPEKPSQMSAWSKEQLGWVDPTTLCEGSDLVLDPVESSGEVYRIYPHGLRSEEYFLLEYRSKTGFDLYLPSSGLAIWHVDNKKTGNGDEQNKLLDLEEADGKNDLDFSRNRGDAGDVYPGSSSNHTFYRSSSPNSNANDGSSTEIALTGIGFEGSELSLSATLTGCRLRLDGLAVDDIEWGDHSLNLDKSERVQLEVCVSNDFDLPRENITVRLKAGSEKITLLDSTSTLGTVSREVSRCAEFWIRADSTVTNGEEIKFIVTLEGSGGYETVHQASLYAGDYVLLVKDDDQSRYLNDYVRAITNAGHKAVVYDTQDLPDPSVGTLQSALAAVWYTGLDSFTTLTRQDQAVLEAFLGGGGTLLLSGDDIGFDLVEDGSVADRSFYETWLKARFVKDVSEINSLSGRTGDPIGEGLSFSLDTSKSKWPSVIEPLGGAQSSLVYSPGNVGAIRYEGDYNLLYTAFNFEAAPVAARSTLMQRFLDRYIQEDRSAPDLELTNALSDEYDACDSVTVTWDARDETQISDVEVVLYSEGRAVRSLAQWSDDPGVFTWDPDQIGPALAFKIVARDPSGLQAVRLTESFSVVDTDPPTVSVTHPNGGENLAPGVTIDITWEQSDCSAIRDATVSVSEDDGETWAEIGAATETGHLAWTPPLEPKSRLRVRVEVFDLQGNTAADVSDETFYLGLNDAFAGATRAIMLQNTPNPFELETISLFFLPEAATVRFTIYDINGRLVRHVFEGPLLEGQHEMPWDGLREDGSRAPIGIYFMVLDSSLGNQVRKLVRF